MNRFVLIGKKCKNFFKNKSNQPMTDKCNKKKLNIPFDTHTHSPKRHLCMHQLNKKKTEKLY